MIENILWLTLETDPSALGSMVEENEGLPRYFRVDTALSGTPEKDMMKLALTSPQAKNLLLELTRLGFSLYYNTTNESRFIRHDRIVHHWPAVKDGSFSISDQGIVHKLEKPESGTFEKLVVVFSPINSKPRLIRYFRPSFATLMKYIPRNTAILRIADVGGVKGAFYLDTNYLPDNSSRIQHLIRTTAGSHGIEKDDIVLFGASKGGTGALYHGISGDWKFVAVDPIVSDLWYENNENDYHFTTGGVFPRSKQEVFNELVSQLCDGSRNSLERSVLITSHRSPQYKITCEVIRPIMNRLSVLTSDNPDIVTHPDVAPKTIYAQVLAINNLLLGLSLPSGETQIP